ncbi:hypothetical protein RND81_14G101100 [Saponaria officinalis]|uniref:RING-type E3 ubiquitin transferase n=1 Tax=Saponaria officinalis TaxID=3572 RepID=A0AAW1GMY2_SAPOF
MKKFNRLIICTLFLSFYILNSINGEFCVAYNCPKGVNRTSFYTEISVKYPFRLKDQQNKSCGVPGFDLYCDKTLGTLIQVPNNLVFRVDDISYSYPNYITLSDPTNCLPRKLMSLNLNDTPFTAGNIDKIWLYNCSRDDYSRYDRIDCLSGPNYTVICSGYDSSVLASSNCSFVQILNVPKSYYSRYSGYLKIDLTWTGFPTPPPPPPPSRPPRPPIYYSNSGNSTTIGYLPGILGGAFAILVIYLCYSQHCSNRTAQATTTTTTANANTTSVVVVVGGLDQVTIDSYPVVVLGETGSVLKSDDDTCSICLSSYQPRETLKILPECLHRFHKDCIDQWLRSKGVCPICRTSPPITSSH